MGNMCRSSRRCGTVRGSCTLSLFSSRGRQITDEWMHCIVNSADLHHVHDTIDWKTCCFYTTTPKYSSSCKADTPPPPQPAFYMRELEKQEIWSDSSERTCGTDVVWR